MSLNCGHAGFNGTGLERGEIAAADSGHFARPREEPGGSVGLTIVLQGDTHQEVRCGRIGMGQRPIGESFDVGRLGHDCRPVNLVERKARAASIGVEGNGPLEGAGGEVEVARAVEAAIQLAEESISARVVNMATIKPIDAALLARCAEETGAIVTAEDHNIHGGLGGAVAESLATTHPCPIEFVGVRDTFGASGEPEDLAHHFGISAPFIADAAKRAIARKRA